MIDIQFKGNLEGVTNFNFKDDVVNPYQFAMRVSCTRCREERDKPARFNRHESMEIPNSKGEANLVMKCKFCNQHQHITVMKLHGSYDISESGKWKSMLELDCRGVDILEFIPDAEFVADSIHNATKFTLSLWEEDGEWYDYDEVEGSEVSITETFWRVVKAA